MPLNGMPESVLTLDEMLDNIMLYRLPAAAASSAQRWAERVYSNIIHWNELDQGGHLAAIEQPELFVREVRNCFRRIRKDG